MFVCVVHVDHETGLRNLIQCAMVNVVYVQQPKHFIIRIIDTLAEALCQHLENVCKSDPPPILMHIAIECFLCCVRYRNPLTRTRRRPTRLPTTAWLQVAR